MSWAVFAKTRWHRNDSRRRLEHESGALQRRRQQPHCLTAAFPPSSTLSTFELRTSVASESVTSSAIAGSETDAAESHQQEQQQHCQQCVSIVFRGLDSTHHRQRKRIPAGYLPSLPFTSMAMADSALTSAFTDFGALLERESDEIEQINKHVRDLHRINRAVSSQLQSIHSTATSPTTLATLAQSATDTLLQHALPVLAALSTLLAASPPYKYHTHYSSALQTTTLHLILAHYCTHRTLLTHPATQHTLRLQPYIAYDVEDYLYAVSGLGKELVRLAVNGVRGGWVSVVEEVSVFLHDLYGGFRLLNLRNDGLRRRVDGLKYDVLRAEEIMYDLTVRGLLKSGSGIVNDGSGSGVGVGVDGESGGQSQAAGATEGRSGVGGGGGVNMKDTDADA